MSRKRMTTKEEPLTKKKVFLVGSPNVGKSAIFNALTGSYVTVSNYPGTTVDIAYGKMRIGRHHKIDLVDTPGMYSLRPITAEEEVGRKLIFKENPDCILHIVDAKNLERMLPLTFQLIETGLPIILVLNLYDELRARGMQLDIAHLEHDIGIPVVETVATRGIGIDNLSSRIVEVIEDRYRFSPMKVEYSEEIKEKIQSIAKHLKNDYAISKETIASLIIQNDKTIIDMVKAEGSLKKIETLCSNLDFNHMADLISQQRREASQSIMAERSAGDDNRTRGGWKDKLSALMVHHIWGVPILGLVLWFGLYKFVGEFGAGTLVDFIETNIFEAIINPKVDLIFHKIFGENLFFGLFAGEYGIFTLGIRYAIAIIFPIVATFFIAFSIIEDTGYLPRLAMLLDRAFKKIGLSGRAVIPLTLGFGCDTMATIVTRTLESTRERVIATFLLSLAIPCSAQLGVLLGLMAGNPKMLFIWALTVSGVFMLAGFLCKHLIKGEDSGFFMELPPLRLPSFMNVFTKTYTRMIWYFKEVIPIFIVASIVIWLGKLTGIFDFLVNVISYPVQWAGMPKAASPAFLYGFFRRDFGVAGLFDLAKQGVLSGNGLLIAAVVLTLFVPCVAQFAVTWKERGKAMAIGMAVFIFPFAFCVGFLLNVLLNALGVSL
ncbi:ferrous iron transport protein B [Candidatus Omnitrophota bacterium]